MDFKSRIFDTVSSTLISFTIEGMDPKPSSDVAAVSALDEPARRALYDWVRRQPHPVTRDDAATAVGLTRSTAAFHLEKLADEGLLAIEFARANGRTGPGAGRPSKYYRRSDRQVTVQLPDRSYELAGQLLAEAIEDSEKTGRTPRSALASRATAFGKRLGNETGPTREEIVAALERCGYEPRDDSDDIVMGNCPFHTLAQNHTDMVCAMNLDLISGLLDSAGCTESHARLDPADGMCCVRIGPKQQ